MQTRAVAQAVVVGVPDAVWVSPLYRGVSSQFAVVLYTRHQGFLKFSIHDVVI
jgi:hypothetical protein